METNARTTVLIFRKIIGTHCDRRDARTDHTASRTEHILIEHKTHPKKTLPGQDNEYATSFPVPMTVRDFSSLCSA